MQVMLFTVDSAAGLSAPDDEQLSGIIEKMKAAYALSEDYRMETEVKVYHEGKVAETEQFLYSFRKPGHIRIDMASPYAGTVIVYPGEDGKVAVKPGGLFGFLRLRLSTDSSLLMNSAGQRIDQTDLGLLIQNIVHSITDRRHGDVRVFDKDGQVRIEVLAEDHFRKGVLTLYHFSIDKTLWLPIEIKEYTQNRVLKREVRFRNLQISSGIPESYFRINGGKTEHGQPGR